MNKKAAVKTVTEAFVRMTAEIGKVERTNTALSTTYVDYDADADTYYSATVVLAAFEGAYAAGDDEPEPTE